MRWLGGLVAVMVLAGCGGSSAEGWESRYRDNLGAHLESINPQDAAGLCLGFDELSENEFKAVMLAESDITLGSGPYGRALADAGYSVTTERINRGMDIAIDVVDDFCS